MSVHRQSAEGPVLADTRVAEVMSTPIVTCQADMPLDEVAELMAGHRIHAIVVVGERDASGSEPRPLRVISETDLVRAAVLGGGATTAGRVAASPIVTVEQDEPLQQAALLMSDHDTTHVIAVERGQPVGIVSALDVAASLVPRHPSPEDTAAVPETSAADGRLHAKPGDRLVVHGHRLGERGRDAEILETRGPGGGIPFLVRWEDTGHVTLLYPGSDASVEHLSRG